MREDIIKRNIKRKEMQGQERIQNSNEAYTPTQHPSEMGEI